ncbi:MAG: ribonuclease Y [Culicoidibacterales bacterium]
MSADLLIPISILFIALGVAVVAYFFGIQLGTKRKEAEFERIGQTARSIVEDAKKEASATKKELLLEAKQETQRLKLEADQVVKDRREEALEHEKRMRLREEGIERRARALDGREQNLDERDSNLVNKQQQIQELENKVGAMYQVQETRLEEIGGYTKQQAKAEIFKHVEDETAHEMVAYIRERESEAKQTADRNAKNLISTAIQRYAAEVVSERTVSVVNLPNDEMKGRIIGREGRNIRTLETLTGVDLIIDDTPEAVVLSCFDPVRREIAKRTLVTLVEDGRIHPGRIEEIVEKSRRDVNEFIREQGEHAVFETVIGTVHPDLIKILGKLHFRTSYGQNVLQHSIEVAFIAGLLAGELGEDVTMARRAGLFHDIGKAIDHELEGSHVEIGMELAKRYGEPEFVINAIGAHHGDVEPNSVISVLVTAADALSASRPGARRESLENYVKRLENLEGIANSFPGVEKSFAIQAGREIRIVVQPNAVDDTSAYKIARNVKERIENELEYPGTIKVTVVREMRAVEVAK